MLKDTRKIWTDAEDEDDRKDWIDYGEEYATSNSIGKKMMNVIFKIHFLIIAFCLIL